MSTATPASEVRHRRGSSVQRRRGNTVIDLVDPAVALDLATHQAYSENVFLFVPNLIGYARVIFAAVSFYYMSTHPNYSTILYGVSALLDAADGKAARALEQESKFGAVLDMVVDRCATSCLLCYLAMAYPYWALLFQFLIALDFSSHYMHMYSSLATGSRSHKLVESDVSRILWLYYNDKRTLFLVCAGNELFYVALYLASSVKTPLSPAFDVLVPAWVPYVHPLTWASAIAWICFPVCFLKNIINMVQLWKASKILVGIDLAERARERQKKLQGQAAQGQATQGQAI